MPRPSSTDDAVRAWLRGAAHPLHTLDPFDDDLSDLEPLLDVVGDARVVLLGESMHRAHEFLLLRHRVLRLLSGHGFDALVLESGLPESRLVDAWVRGDVSAPVREVLERGITYHHGKCDESLDLVAWLRKEHVAGRPLALWGMDVPDSGSSALPAVKLLVEALDVVDPVYARRARRELLPLFDYLPQRGDGIAQAATAIHAYLALPPALRFELTARIAELAARVPARALDYLAAGAAPEDVATWLHLADNVRAADAFLAVMPGRAEDGFPPGNVRDVAMADSVDRVLARSNRVLVVAAGGHVQRSPFHAPPFVPDPMTTLGRELTARLGGDVVVIGTTYGGGQAWLHRPAPGDGPGESTAFVEQLPPPRADSMDALLDDALDVDAFVDLRTVPPDVAGRLDAVKGTHNGPELVLADVRTAFDAVVHVHRIGPWRTWLPTSPDGDPAKRL